MSYQVIARKWRPQAFEDLVGQGHISQTLLNALRNDRLHHALLFTGSRGTGKTSTARILAKSLRCPQAKNYVPCHECQECLDIAAGRSIDVVEVDGASNNGVEAVRELRDTVGYMPSSGPVKLYIIDEVHMLSASAFNALLKTLEEPPSHVVFVLATTEVHKVPNTILSRCQRFDFRRISMRCIAERLEAICSAEEVKADKESLWMIARQAQGSMRDSQSLLDQVITFSEGQITMDQVTEVLGLTDRALLVKTLQALIERSNQKAVEVIETLFMAGYDPSVYMQDLLEELRHLLLVKLSPDSVENIVDLPDSEIEHLREMSSQLSEEDIHLLFDMALKGANEIPRAQDPRVLLEMLLLRMSQAPRIQSLASVAPPATKPSFQKTARKSTSPPKETPSGTANTNTANPTSSKSLEEQWGELVTKIKNSNSLLGAKLENTSLTELKDNTLVLNVPQSMKIIYDQLNNNEARQDVQKAVAEHWNKQFDIEIRLGDEKTEAPTPKARQEQKTQEHKERVRQEVEEHPLIQSTQSVFKTEIQSIKENKS